MALSVSTPTSSLLHPSAGAKPSPLCSFSASSISIPKNAVIFQKCIPRLGFTQWNGLRSTGSSISRYSVRMERKGRRKGKGAYASLFGVGAPEVLVIGVVALLVFGPKGLAEVARNLGKTLRAFQPTIRELQEVSREFKSTLEREIGLDDIDQPVPKRSSSNTTKPTAEDLGTNSEPNADVSSSEKGDDPADNYLRVRADRFTGALAQLQKEQEEEERQKEEERQREKEQAQSQGEPESPSEDTPQAVDTPTEASSDTSTSESPDNNALQEAASMAPTGSPQKTESQT